MAGLNDLAALLGQTTDAPSTDLRKRGYDGNVIRIKVRLQKRRGKPLTAMTGFQARPKELEALLATFRRTLGTGGQVLDNAIELQGDHVQRAGAILKDEGYQVG